jgi:U3 small nucleolar RNA-associated protein 5
MSTKRKLPTKLGQPTVKPSAKPYKRTALDESRTVVSASGLQEDTQDPDRVEDSSGRESDDDDLEDLEPDVDQAIVDSLHGVQQDADMVDADGEDDEGVDGSAEPSFGELVRTNMNPIDVAAPFAVVPEHAPNNLIAAPSGASLATVLAQALKTNDTSLLESCLQTTDLATIRSTIQRLAPPLASSLLSVLTSRLHRRPGRAGSLMVWVQWTLVSHGGYLATQKDLIKQLTALNRVIDERTRGLQGLLLLKGKLDMLEAQGLLRRSMMGRARADSEGELAEEDVVYVEGQESDDEPPNAIAVRKTDSVGRNTDVDGESEEEMPNTAGEMVDASESEVDSENLIDDEAVESDSESGDEDDVDHDDEDEMDSAEESDDALPARSAPSAKIRKTGELFSQAR